MAWQVTFPQGMSAEQVVKVMIRLSGDKHRIGMRKGKHRVLITDLVYLNHETKWLDEAANTAHFYGLVLYQDGPPFYIWRTRPMRYERPIFEWEL